MVIAAPKSQTMNNFVETQVYMLSKAEGGRKKPMTSGQQLHVFSKSWDCPAFIVLDEDNKLVMPGEDSTIKLHFQKKMVGSNLPDLPGAKLRRC